MTIKNDRSDNDDEVKPGGEAGETVQADTGVPKPEHTEREKQEATEKFEGELRDWMQKQIDSGMSFKDLESVVRGWTQEFPRNKEESDFRDSKKQLNDINDSMTGVRYRAVFGHAQEGLPIGLKVLAEFGKTERSEYDKKNLNGHDTAVIYNPDDDGYAITFPDMNFEDGIKLGLYREGASYMRTSFRVYEAPEVAREVFDHMVKATKPEDGVVEMFQKGSAYYKEIRDGEGLEKKNPEGRVTKGSNVERAREAFRELEAKLAEVLVLQKAMEKDQDFAKRDKRTREVVMQMFADKRAGLVANWRQKFEAIKTKDREDKDRAEIDRLHESLAKI